MAEKETDFSGKEQKVIGGPTGKFLHSLDQKKRLAIPSEWQTSMGRPEFVYVYPDMSRTCLNLIPPYEMEKIRAVLDRKSLFDPEAAAIRAAFGENSQMIKVDSAGRIRINDELLEFAGITGKVTLKGAVRNVEIWASENLPPEPEKKKIDIAAMRAAMAKLQTMAE